MTPSYDCEFGEPSKASRIQAFPRDYEGIEPLGPALDAEAGAPEFVLVPRSGSPIVVKQGSKASFLNESGWQDLILGEGRTLVAAWPEGLAQGGKLQPWGAPAPQLVPVPQWAYEFVVEHARWTDGSSMVGVYEGSHAHSPAQVEVVSAPISEGHHPRDPRSWTALVPGTGTAAITADGRTVLVLSDGLLKVFAREGQEGKAQSLGEVRLQPAYLVSIVHGSAMVLQARVMDPDTRLPSFPLRRFALQGAWTTRITAVPLSDPLPERPYYEVEVPFEVLQPPIEGGAGRFYLVGCGLAALGARGIEWQMRSTSILLATSFVDGTLAISVGSELRIVTPEGHIRQSLQLPTESPITTPPAIGPDGTVYVATREQVYAAR